MSIYPVKLNDWYPKGDEMNEIAILSVKFSNCLQCNKKGKDIKYRYAIGHHSIPWGNGDIWCTKKCYDKWLKK